MSEVRCFVLRDLPFERLWLRRYADGPCPSMPGEYSYHHAMVIWRERAPAEKKIHPLHGYPTIQTLGVPPAHEDARWPTRCACGFEFPAEAEHQLFPRQIWATDDNREMTLEDAPVGAMWNCWWFADRREYKGPGSFVGPDGLSLNVKTPGGDWLIDGPSYSEDGERMTGGWARSGTPPEITVTPSIRCLGGKGKPDKYHGWLRGGVLVPC